MPRPPVGRARDGRSRTRSQHAHDAEHVLDDGDGGRDCDSAGKRGDGRAVLVPAVRVREPQDVRVDHSPGGGGGVQGARRDGRHADPGPQAERLEEHLCAPAAPHAQKLSGQPRDQVASAADGDRDDQRERHGRRRRSGGGGRASEQQRDCAADRQHVGHGAVLGERHCVAAEDDQAQDCAQGHHDGGGRGAGGKVGRGRDRRLKPRRAAAGHSSRDDRRAPGGDGGARVAPFQRDGGSARGVRGRGHPARQRRGEGAGAGGAGGVYRAAGAVGAGGGGAGRGDGGAPGAGGRAADRVGAAGVHDAAGGRAGARAARVRVCGRREGQGCVGEDVSGGTDGSSLGAVHFCFLQLLSPLTSLSPLLSSTFLFLPSSTSPNPSTFNSGGGAGKLRKPRTPSHFSVNTMKKRKKEYISLARECTHTHTSSCTRGPRKKKEKRKKKPK